MAVSSAQVAMSTTAARIIDGGGGENSILIQNTGATTVYVGGSGVTSATGYPLAAGVEYELDLTGSDTLYGVTASGSSTVAVLRTGV